MVNDLSTSTRARSGPDDSDRGWITVRAVDRLDSGSGSGVGVAIRLHGCPLRCQACRGHGDSIGGQRIEVETLVGRVAASLPFIALTGGAVTVGGGEPLAQAPAVAALFRRCRDLGIATVLDTTGDGSPFSAQGLLYLSDRVVLDVTGRDAATLFGRPEIPGVAFARRVAARGTPLWLRLTLIPGLTDRPSQLDAIARFAAELGTVEQIRVVAPQPLDAADLLRGCRWSKLRTAAAPTVAELGAARARFRQHGLRAA